VDEAALLESEQTAQVFVGERELARAMTEHVLGHMTPVTAPAARAA
jgi:hypothetical protein